MAREEVDVQTVDTQGLSAVYDAAPADGISFVNDDGRVILHVKNTDAAARTVTVQSVAEIDGIAIDDLAVVVAAASEAFIGPFAPETYNQGEDPDVDVDFGKVYVDFSAVAGVSVAVVEVP